MDLFRPNTLKGEWFPYLDDGEALCRLIPNDVDGKFHKTRYGDRTREQIEKEGGDNLGMVTLHLYLVDRACFALVDTRNVWVPKEIVAAALASALAAEGPRPEERVEGEAIMVRLDGFWSEPVKRAVLNECMESGRFGYFLLECSKSLGAKAKAKKEALGKA